ncbi:DUF3761 domain-containing protein [Streptomyces sp. NPDC049577]|uniref:DUF3761 domain-containing protein n=1 Tax=Streptomyces sp. NPDC049577 TaxID=3155153 RepID=UPI0034330535
MNVSEPYRARRAGAALVAVLALGFGAVACDDSDGGKSPGATPSASTSATAAPFSPVPTRVPTPTAVPTPAPARTPAHTSAPSAPARPAPTGAPTQKPAAGDAHSGASALCNDGTYSYSAHRRGTCSHHGGVARWLKDLPS